MHHRREYQTDVLILCGGLGKRLRSVVRDKPKPLAEIDKRAFLDLLIDCIAGYGFKRFILCTGYMGAAIAEHYGKPSEGVEILFSQEGHALGTAGAVKNAEPLIRSNPFLVANGDSFCKVNLSEFLNFHQKNSASLSMVVTRSQNSKDFGTITLSDSQEIVLFEEKKAGTKEAFINAGIYLMDKNILSLIPSDRKYSLEVDLFPQHTGRGFYGYVVTSELIDIGTPERYKQAVNFFSRHQSELGLK
jgi:D-glycero-alpha-D-manno-heptose 1-phosphate guanylyltransferase